MPPPASRLLVPVLEAALLALAADVADENAFAPGVSFFHRHGFVHLPIMAQDQAR